MKNLLSKLKSIIFPYVSQKEYNDVKLENYGLRKKLIKQELRCQFLENQNKRPKIQRVVGFRR